MDRDHIDAERLPSEPPQVVAHEHDRDERMSQGTAQVSEDASAVNGNVGAGGAAPSQIPSDPYAEQVQSVVSSEVSLYSLNRSMYQTDQTPQIGVQTLLNRLKQSIASAKVC